MYICVYVQTVYIAITCFMIFNRRCLIMFDLHIPNKSTLCSSTCRTPTFQLVRGELVGPAALHILQHKLRNGSDARAWETCKKLGCKTNLLSMPRIVAVSEAEMLHEIVWFNLFLRSNTTVSAQRIPSES